MSPKQQQILDRLRNAPASSSLLSAITGLPQPSVRRELSELVKAGYGIERHDNGDRVLVNEPQSAV